MKLIIVESPTKARTLSRFLGKEFSVEATMGHIKDLPKSKLSVDVDKNFAPDYQLVEGKNKSVAQILKEAKKAKKIFLATDPDREGEAIAEHVYETLCVDGKNKVKKEDVKRIVFHEITKSAVESAIAKPGSVNKNLVNAQIARRVLDRLVGYKLSPILWKKVRRGLSAGRVQSVSVRLIVEKEREIEAFKAEEYWEIYCDLKSQKSDTKDQKFRARLVKINDEKAQVANKKSAEEIVGQLEKSDYKVTDVVKKEVVRSPYPPFTTSTMTQSGARLFHWSAKKTMSVAQKLYEEGLITYHRTDSVHLAKAAQNKVRTYIQKEFGEEYLSEKPRFFKTKSKIAQEAHEAIRPTKVGTTADKLSMTGRFADEGKRLYGLIWKRFVACQMENAAYDQTRVEIVANPKVKNQKSEACLLRASGQMIKFDGWRKVIPAGRGGSGKSANGEIDLPELVKEEMLDLLEVLSEQKFTQPPARFNEASLIRTLEKLGIGRPSTYAPTISTILDRQYVEKEERNFKPTPVGFAVNDFLIGNFPEIFEYSFTAGMEDDLDNVAHGKRKWTEMMVDFYKPFEKKITKVEEKAKRVKIPTEKLGKKCSKCKKGEVVIRFGRFGKFVSCSEFPDCDYKEKYVEKIGMKCPDCKKGDVIIKTTKRGRKFFGCSAYPDCKWASWKNPKAKEKE